MMFIFEKHREEIKYLKGCVNENEKALRKEDSKEKPVGVESEQMQNFDESVAARVKSNSKR